MKRGLFLLALGFCLNSNGIVIYFNEPNLEVGDAAAKSIYPDFTLSGFSFDKNSAGSQIPYATVDSMLSVSPPDHDSGGMILSPGSQVGVIEFAAPVNEFQALALLYNRGVQSPTMTVSAFDSLGGLVGTFVSGPQDLVLGDYNFTPSALLFGPKGNRTPFNRVEISADAPFGIDLILYNWADPQVDPLLLSASETIDTPDAGPTAFLLIVGCCVIFALRQKYFAL